MKSPLLYAFAVLLVPASPGRAANNLRPEHTVVFAEAGKFAGWPANWGVWNWGNEILVGFTLADHQDRPSSHPYDSRTGLAKFARSVDGGRTWTVEDGFERGITGATFEHHPGGRAVEPVAPPRPFVLEPAAGALTFRMHNLRDGPTSWYFSTNPGRRWNGPYMLEVAFPDRSPAGIVSRTSYIRDQADAVTAFVTVGFRAGDRDWREVACIRTTDGGLTWKHLAWIGEPQVNAIMPSAVRLSAQKLVVAVRRTAPPELACYVSEDNGNTWRRSADPARVDRNGSPPALLRLADGRLAIVYGLRERETAAEGIGIYVRFSSDEGTTWSKEQLVRGGDAPNWDIGYPVAVQRPDGKIVAIYYYNHANDPARSHYRYIAATVFDPVK